MKDLDSGMFALNNSSLPVGAFDEIKLVENPKLEGARQAGRAGCDVNVLRMCFNMIFQKTKEDIDGLSDNQKRQIADLEKKITGLGSHNQTLEGEIENNNNIVTEKNKKIENLKKTKNEKNEECNIEIKKIREEIDKIRSGDKDFIDDESKDSDKLGFGLGLTILLFLSIYLFIFYISVIYSAFIFDVSQWVQQNLQNKQILTNSIVNLQAIPDTYAKDGGVLGVIFLFSAAFLFIGLGYLIHKFQESKSIVKSVLIYTFTLLFDALLAYTIVRDIHEAKFQSGIVYTQWKFMDVFSSTNFYIILMAGFSIYVIWGVILSYVLKEYDSLAPAKNAIRSRKKKIKHIEEDKKDIQIQFTKDTEEVNVEISSINDKIQALRTKIENDITAIETNNKEMEHIKLRIEFPIAEVKRRITEFTLGWSNQINLIFQDNDAIQRVSECRLAKEEFFNSISNSSNNDTI